MPWASDDEDERKLQAWGQVMAWRKTLTFPSPTKLRWKIVIEYRASLFLHTFPHSISDFTGSQFFLITSIDLGILKSCLCFKLLTRLLTIWPTSWYFLNFWQCLLFPAVVIYELLALAEIMPFLDWWASCLSKMQCLLVNSYSNIPKFNINCTLPCSVLILYGCFTTHPHPTRSRHLKWRNQVAAYVFFNHEHNFLSLKF